MKEKGRKEIKNSSTVTKTICLAEFVSGADSKPTGYWFIAVLNPIDKNGPENSYINTNLTPVSWGYDEGFIESSDEYQVAAILDIIAKQFYVKGMKGALTLLASLGAKGIKVSLTDAEWKKTEKPFGWSMPHEGNLRIPQPPKPAGKR